MYQPLAARIRPTSLDDFVGQKHLVGEGKPLRKIIESGVVPNMIFYGYSGIGKTTLARIIADKTGKTLYVLNATTASTGDIKQIISELDSLTGENGVLLYLDEIQYFNKKQQQILLEFIENGRITLIAATTENPYFYVYNAILSRSTIFEFRPVEKNEILKAVNRAFSIVKADNIDIVYTIKPGVAEHISESCGGDVRKAINAVELLAALKPGQKEAVITVEDAKVVSQKSNMRYDRDGDAHYDILSALQKSIRGSDENAALHYLARLLEGGDLASACRRILVIASEDIGLAYPQAITIVKACVDSALQLGLPEARLPLGEAVLLLATAPKSNSVICAVDKAIERVRSGEYGDIPDHLKDSHYAGAVKMGHGTEYKYPHSYENNYIEQQYLPDAIKDDVYYGYGNNKNEQAAKAYWEKIKKKK